MTTKAQRESAEIMHNSLSGNNPAINELIELLRIQRDNLEEYQRLSATLAEIQGSVVWKVSKPLRAFGKARKALFEAPRSLKLSVRSMGGLQRTFHLAAQYIRTHGVRSTWGVATQVLKQQGSRTSLYSNYGELFRRELRPILQRKLADFRETHGSQSEIRVTVVMPVYKPSLQFFAEAVQSVLDQSHGNLELIIVDDGSNSHSLSTLINHYLLEDARVKVIVHDKNKGIAEATNTGIRASSGDYLGFMDQDDLLERNALETVVAAFKGSNGAKWAYSDEDVISPSGDFLSPHLKPAFDPLLLMQINYVNHFTVFQKTFLDEIGLLNRKYDGVQDHELLLRASERVDLGDVIHIPHILYHWRAHPQSTAGNPDAKGQLSYLRREIVVQHLNRLKLSATVTWSTELPANVAGNALRFVCPQSKKVSLVIPTRDRFDLLRQTVETLVHLTDYTDFEIVIVDNQTQEKDALDYLLELEKANIAVVVRDSGDFNFSRLINKGVQASSGQLICLLNNDVEIVSSAWLAELVACSQLPGVGAVGARLWFPTGTLQHGGVVLGLGPSRIAGHSHKGLPKGSPGYLGRATYHQFFSAVTGACLLVSRGNFDSVGGFDENLEVGYNDVDFCLKLGAIGLRNVWSPVASLIHHESASRGYDTSPDKIRRASQEAYYMKDKWGALLEHDPSYHPLHTRRDESFGLASSAYELELLEIEGLFRRRMESPTVKPCRICLVIGLGNSTCIAKI